MSILYFESSNKQTMLLGKFSSFDNLVIFILQCFIAFSRNYLNEDNYDYLKLLIILLILITAFYLIVIKTPYYNRVVQTVQSVYCVIACWTFLMLFAAKLLEGDIIDGSFVIWIVCLPFICFFISTLPNRNIKLLLLQWNKVLNPELIIK